MKTIRTNLKVLNIAKNVLIYVLLAAQVGLAAYYLLAGVSNAFGMRVNVFSAATLCLSIMNIAASSLYKVIFGSLLGIYYYVFAVRMVKAIFTSVQYMKSSLKNIELNTQTVNAVTLIFENFGKCLYFSIAFTVISRIASFYKIPAGVIAVFAVSMVLIFVAKFIIELIKHNDVLNAAYKNIVSQGIFCAAILLLLASLSTTSIGTTFGIFKALLTASMYSEGAATWAALLDQFVVGNILIIILQILVLAVLIDFLTYPSYRVINRDSVKQIFIFSLVIAASHVVISGVVANEMGFELANALFGALKHYLPIVSFSGIAYYSFFFPTDFSLSEFLGKSESEEENDVNNAENQSEEAEKKSEETQSSYV